MRGVVKKTESNVSCSTGDIKDALTLLRRGRRWADAWVERSNKAVFPEAMSVERHEIIHGIVGGGDGCEDCANYGKSISYELIERTPNVQDRATVAEENNIYLWMPFATRRLFRSQSGWSRHFGIGVCLIAGRGEESMTGNGKVVDSVISICMKCEKMVAIPEKKASLIITGTPNHVECEAIC